MPRLPHYNSIFEVFGLPNHFQSARDKLLFDLSMQIAANANNDAATQTSEADAWTAPPTTTLRSPPLPIADVDLQWATLNIPIDPPSFDDVPEWARPLGADCFDSELLPTFHGLQKYVNADYHLQEAMDLVRSDDEALERLHPQPLAHRAVELCGQATDLRERFHRLQTAALHVILTGSTHRTALSRLEEEVLNLGDKVEIVYHHAAYRVLETTALRTLFQGYPATFEDPPEPTAAQRAMRFPAHLVRSTTDATPEGAADTRVGTPDENRVFAVLSPEAQALRQERIATIQTAIEQLQLSGESEATVVLNDETGQNTAIVHLTEQVGDVSTASKSDISDAQALHIIDTRAYALLPREREDTIRIPMSLPDDVHTSPPMARFPSLPPRTDPVPAGTVTRSCYRCGQTGHFFDACDWWTCPYCNVDAPGHMPRYCPRYNPVSAPRWMSLPYHPRNFRRVQGAMVAVPTRHIPSVHVDQLLDDYDGVLGHGGIVDYDGNLNGEQ